MNFLGKAKRLDDIDIPRIGSILGVGEDELHAVMEVEAGKRGFDVKGRPAMLFEPHVFYKFLADEPLIQSKASREGLAYPKWGMRKYPSDSYPVLEKAILLSPHKALLSASWGFGQVMGYNHQLAGYPTVESMIDAFKDDEEDQLMGMTRFIRNSGLDDELRAHDWSGFARGYNGPSYAKKGYHLKLAEAFHKWQRIKDTPWSPNDPPTEVKPVPVKVSAPTGLVAAISAIAAALTAAGVWLVNHLGG